VFRKLPADFDADRYRAAYPDVRLSGLTPKQHYLEFGRHLGRSPSGRLAGAVEAKPQAGPNASETGRAVKNGPDVATSEAEPASRSEAIIDRPEGFDPSVGLPTPAPPRKGAGSDGTIRLSDLADGPFADASAGGRIAAPLRNYAKLLSLDAPANLDEVEVAEPDQSLFQQGPTRIGNAWFAGPTTIRLMIGDGASEASISTGWILRAYQATADEPERLRPAGQGVSFSSEGPVFVDLELSDPLLPLILELENSEDLTRAIALWPFPSLLPGGLHAAELKALQNESNPMDAFWSLADILLKETVGEAGWPARSVQEIAFHAAPKEEGATAGLPGFEPWLKAVFGLPIQPSKKRRRDGGVRLLLPENSVPTVSALASRRLDIAGNERLTGPLLVTGGEKARPRWSVVPPSDAPNEATFPALEQVRPSARDASAESTVPIHLAIANRQPGEPAAFDQASQASEGSLEPITVLLLKTEEKRADETMRLLREISGTGELEVHIISRVEQLRRIARESRHDKILTVGDCVKFDLATLQVLCRMLREKNDIGSVSCVLLGERIVKKDRVSQPAFGGIFPAGVSFSSSPRLSFSEPDLLEALPSSTYPVVANTFNLTVWDRSALARLPELDGPIPTQAADIRLGLDLMEIGYRSLCTTTVSATIDGPYLRRDAIDPMGAAYLQPRRWEHILKNVTILRELF